MNGQRQGRMPGRVTPNIVTSGLYTPTLYNTTNVAASTPYVAQYMRVGNVVTVAGIMSIDTTSAAATVIGISLPIPSAFVNNGDLGGVGSFTTESARIYADTANARAVMGYTSGNTNAIQWSFIFTYVIV
jgi:hypothetical protein